MIEEIKIIDSQLIHLPLPRSSEQLLFIFSIFLVCNLELSSSSTKPKVSVS